MKTYSIEQTNGNTVKFTGKLVACSSSYSATNCHNWTELHVFHTRANNYVLQVTGNTSRANQIKRIRASVHSTLQDLATAAGHGWLARDVYKQLRYVPVTYA